MTTPHLVAAAAAIPGVMLIWAGTLKLRRPAPAAAAIVRFKLARRVRPSVGRLAGALELGAGAGLITSPSQPLAFAAPIVLLSLFAFLIARALAGGETFSCACFGATTEAMNAWTLLRTSTLLATAVVTLAIVIVDHPSSLSASEVLRVSSTVGLALSLVLLVRVLRSTTPFTD